jgi:Sec-independent protein translocase protein TatA
MRAGLKSFLETGPHQLDQLRHVEQSSDPFAAGYRKSLGDAIDDFTDALDGATKALSEQTKVFGELKREEKVDAQTAKEREKDEKKHAKEEEKLRKKEHEKGPPTDKDEN